VRTAVLAGIFCAAASILAHAHVGSPDVFFEGAAGAYRLFVVVRMPQVIPGVAAIEVRALSPGVRSIAVTPMRIRGMGSELAPAADVAERVDGASDTYRAELWLMQRGAWKMHIRANGDHGDGELAVPVGAVSLSTRPMAPWLKLLLATLGILLVAGAVAIIGASVREASTPPGADPPPAALRRSRIVMVIASVTLAAILAGANAWWKSDAADAEALVYRVPRIDASLTKPWTLSLALGRSNNERWAERVGINDLVPDHEHLMHLFMIRDPGMDFMLHLHPERQDDGRFEQVLPSMPEGRYRIYADVVHGTGFPETETGEVLLPQIVSGLPRGDDALTETAPLAAGPQMGRAPLSNGARLQWLNGSDPIRARQPVWLKFRVEDLDGNAVADLEPYMGMPGHLAVVRADWRVFAHLHPAGTAPIAAVQLANGPAMTTHAGHFGATADITFPYGFPDAGHYRLFVQIKRAGRVETAVFDTEVS
jgi:hypothetical protein